MLIFDEENTMSLNQIAPNIYSAGRLPNDEEKAIMWRDSELSATDWIVPVTDHPQHADYLTYRQALWSWPNEITFPATRPVL
jgi:hypothetical protein